MNPFARLASWWRDTAGFSLPPLPHLEHEDSRGPFREPPSPPDLAIDDDGWLEGDAVIRMPSRRGGTSPLLSAGTPVCVVRHGTATARGTGGAIARSWRATSEPHSAHLTIDVITETSRDAEVARWSKLGWFAEADRLESMAPGSAVIYQHRSLLTTSWHAYGSTDGQRTSGTIDGRHFNTISIGIEATCVGQVARKLDNEWRGWKSGKGVGHGPSVPADQVQTIGGRSWHMYHPSVLAIEADLDAVLLARFPSLAGNVTITPSPYTAAKIDAKPVTRPAMAVGHVDVDPTRKSDPYPTGERRGL